MFLFIPMILPPAFLYATHCFSFCSFILILIALVCKTVVTAHNPTTHHPQLVTQKVGGYSNTIQIFRHMMSRLELITQDTAHICDTYHSLGSSSVSCQNHLFFYLLYIYVLKKIIRRLVSWRVFLWNAENFYMELWMCEYLR